MKRLPTETRRVQIADAALTIIARDGLGRFTTAAIAKEVGLSEGAIFRHFASKDEIIDGAIDRLEELLFPAPQPPHDSLREDAPIQRLRDFLAGRLELIEEKPGFLRVILSNELGQAAYSKAKERVADLRTRSIATVMHCLRDARTQGLIRDDVHLESLVGIIQGALMFRVFSEAPCSADMRSEFERVWADIEVLIRPLRGDSVDAG